MVGTKTVRQCYDFYQIRKNRPTDGYHQWTANEITLVREMMDEKCSAL